MHTPPSNTFIATVLGAVADGGKRNYYNTLTLQLLDKCTKPVSVIRRWIISESEIIFTGYLFIID